MTIASHGHTIGTSEQQIQSDQHLEGVGAKNRVSGTGLKLLLHARNAAFSGPARDCRRF